MITLSVREVRRLVAAARYVGRHGERDAGLVWICYSHALAVSELVALQWVHIDFATGKLLINRGYHGAPGEHNLSEEEIRLLRTLQVLPQSSDYVFCSELGNAMSARAVHTIIARAGKIAGLGHVVHPQMLKDSRGQALANEGLDVAQIQAFFGHKRAEKVAVYVSRAQKPYDESRSSTDAEILASEANELMIDRDKVARYITLTIPASTCNLGPGLDTLGLALSLYTRVTVWLLKKDYTSIPKVILGGAMADKSYASDQGDLIYTILTKLWKSTPRDASRLRVALHSSIPLGSGLGGTGTAILGSLWASYVLRDLIPTQAKILAESTAAEGHPESLAPSLMGNLVVCGATELGDKVITEQIEWPEQWHIIVITPPYRLTTAKARQVLPKQVKLEDAVFNIQRTALLVAAVQNQNEATLKQVLDDRLHERYRRKLVPELEQIRALMHKQPIIGCVLSGAGSSVLVIVNHKRKEAVLSYLRKSAASELRTSSILDLMVDRTGLREIACE